MDLVVGTGHSCLQVLSLMRKTRKELIFKIPNKDLRKHKKNFRSGQKRRRKDSFKNIFKSITSDNGA